MQDKKEEKNLYMQMNAMINPLGLYSSESRAVSRNFFLSFFFSRAASRAFSWYSLFDYNVTSCLRKIQWNP